MTQENADEYFCSANRSIKLPAYMLPGCQQKRCQFLKGGMSMEYDLDEKTGKYHAHGYIDVTLFCTVTKEEKELLEKAEDLLNELENRNE